MQWSEMTTIVFKGWNTSNSTQYFFSLVALFFMCIANHVLAHLRHKIHHSQKNKNAGHPTNHAKPLLDHDEHHLNHTDTNLLLEEGKQKSHVLVDRILQKLLMTVLYGAHITLGYILMLAVMTYNAGIFVTIIAGSCVGYFLVEQDAQHH